MDEQKLSHRLIAASAFFEAASHLRLTMSDHDRKLADWAVARGLEIIGPGSTSSQLDRLEHKIDAIQNSEGHSNKLLEEILDSVSSTPPGQGQATALRLVAGPVVEQPPTSLALPPPTLPPPPPSPTFIPAPSQPGPKPNLT